MPGYFVMFALIPVEYQAGTPHSSCDTLVQRHRRFDILMELFLLKLGTRLSTDLMVSGPWALAPLAGPVDLGRFTGVECCQRSQFATLLSSLGKLNRSRSPRLRRRLATLAVYRAF